MNTECDVIRDLIPLCVDGAASRESSTRVSVHIATCAECRRFYDTTRAAGLRRRRPELSARQIPYSGIARRLRRRRMLLAGGAALLAVSLAYNIISAAAGEDDKTT